MKITELETILLPQIPFPYLLKPAWGASEWKHFDMVIVKVHTDEGVGGHWRRQCRVGEADT